MNTITIARRKIAVTNLDKVFYPTSGFTKGDLLRYYQAIAPVILPHLADRPVTLKRYPDGVTGTSFYEKRCPGKRPRWITSAKVRSTLHGSIDFCVVANAPTLLWQTNRAAIEFHPYLYRTTQEDQPTMLVFDLDPGAPATLADCLDIAVLLRDILADQGLQSFAKTSGGKGLHIGVPLRGAAFPEVKSFAHALADLLAHEEPKRITSTMAKRERTGRVFIDWSQNDHGKTTVCAYSLRARERPTVSTPVSWDEIDAARRRGTTKQLHFEADDVLRRVADIGDLFAPTLTLRQKLPQPARTASRE